MWKFMYDQTRVWFVCNRAIQMYLWPNDTICQMRIRTAWSSKQMHIQKYISFPDWALHSRQQHHFLRRNAKSSNSLAIKMFPRRINCNSVFIAYHLSTCLWEYQLEIPLPVALKPYHWHSWSSHKTNQLLTTDTDNLLVLTITAATDKSW
jgi:hypothetical protein